MYSAGLSQQQNQLAFSKSFWAFYELIWIQNSTLLLKSQQKATPPLMFHNSFFNMIILRPRRAA